MTEQEQSIIDIVLQSREFRRPQIEALESIRETALASNQHYAEAIEFYSEAAYLQLKAFSPGGALATIESLPDDLKKRIKRIGQNAGTQRFILEKEEGNGNGNGPPVSHGLARESMTLDKIYRKESP